MNDRELNDPNLDAPEKFRAALARSQARRVVVPPAMDDAVLRAARERLKPGASSEPAALLVSQKAETLTNPMDPKIWGGQRLRNWLLSIFVLPKSLGAFTSSGTGSMSAIGRRRFAPLTAAVATFVATGVLVWLTVHPRAAARPEDLNADGQVDMLDAFALARELQQGHPPRPQLDLTGDGVVDERDVQALANRAVSLETGGRS